MTFLPIVEREMRVAARRRSTYGTRLRIAGLATLGFAICFAVSDLAPTFPFGQTLFWGLAGFCMIYCLLAGRLMTADCLSREKRDGTLGLLFLTDLKGYDVVLGKLAATSLDGFYGLLAVFPLLAIPILAGGMTNGELWRMVLVLVNTFLFSLAIGLLASALSRQLQAAMGVNLGLMVLLAGLLPVLGGLLYSGLIYSVTRIRPVYTPNHIQPDLGGFFYTCPIFSFLQCADAVYKKTPFHFWNSIGTTFCLTIMLVALACRVAPRSWQDNPVTARSLKLKQRREKGRRRWWFEGRRESALAFRREGLALDAYYWLAARPYLKAAYVWAAFILFAVWWCLITNSIGYLEESANFTVAFLLNGLLKMWIATEAGQQLAEDKRSGAFELLLSTPLTSRDIVRGQWQALRHQFLRPVLAAVALEVFFMFSFRHPRTQEQHQAWGIWLAGILMLLADTFTIAWVAMSAALTEKSHSAATAKTAASVLALPWSLFAAVAGITSLWELLFSRVSVLPDWPYYVAWWLGLGLAVDFVLVSNAKKRLENSFRQFALQHFPPKSRLAWLRAWREESPERKGSTRHRLRRAALAAAAVLVMAVVMVFYVVRPFQVPLPQPVIVSVTPSGHPLQVFAQRGSFLFIMPDGALWRWGHPTWGMPVDVSPPQRVGRDTDWMQASVLYTNAAGLRSDGTLWTWPIRTDEPKQVGSGHDWVEACAGPSFYVGRRKDGTLWAWGDNSKDQLGNDHGPSHRYPTQIGTNRDWAAVTTCIGDYAMALRTDGTLWIWGAISYSPAAGGSAFKTYPRPTQICRESNWIGFNKEYGFVRNRTGEWWTFFPLRGDPKTNAPASAIGQLAFTNAGSEAIGPCFAGTNWVSAVYRVQPNGTLSVSLWAPPPLSSLAHGEAPFQFGRRTDWVSVWGNYSTMIGLTSDGTLWTWGLDSGQERHLDLGDRAHAGRDRLTELLGGRPRRSLGDEWGGYQAQKEPRPLVRLTPSTTLKP